MQDVDSDDNVDRNDAGSVEDDDDDARESGVEVEVGGAGKRSVGVVGVGAGVVGNCSGVGVTADFRSSPADTTNDL